MNMIYVWLDIEGDVITDQVIQEFYENCSEYFL